LPGLSDQDSKTKSSLKACEAKCKATAGCVAIRLHHTDNHCHIITGTLPSKATFESSLVAASAYEACFVVAK